MQSELNKVLSELYNSNKKIGEQLVGELIVQSELNKVLSELYSSNKKIGEQLVEKRIISTEQLEKLLGEEQLPPEQLLFEEKLILQYEP